MSRPVRPRNTVIGSGTGVKPLSCVGLPERAPSTHPEQSPLYVTWTSKSLFSSPAGRALANVKVAELGFPGPPFGVEYSAAAGLTEKPSSLHEPPPLAVPQLRE